jgi:anti-sigma regulatory factor (Ser/Thr protein kinase)
LIASWLGVSVTTMLLAEELVSESEAGLAEAAEIDFARAGRDWDKTGAAKPGDFFAQARALISDGADTGALEAEQAEALMFLISRIEQEKTEMASVWEEAELRKSLPANDMAPRAARQALAVVAEGISDERLAVARLLLSELVTNSVRHGPPGPTAKVGIFIRIERNLLRAEVSDGSLHGARPRTPGEDGGYGLMLLESLATHWGASREGGVNLTWFELDLPSPGTTT